MDPKGQRSIFLPILDTSYFPLILIGWLKWVPSTLLVAELLGWVKNMAMRYCSFRHNGKADDASPSNKLCRMMIPMLLLLLISLLLLLLLMLLTKESGGDLEDY